ncbi:hypothetical protein PMIN06_010124 [Paraphaeosphaeria minitans]|uniref:Uncharacterized protein n=1 Tax=Paraphaeosphaeria minitans TaxID=565426 RepID=A0A9P6GIR8_9PLEO|nr:hypothetical protein PMIN01_05650 [Paraphaeosphaeria minitans]
MAPRTVLRTIPPPPLGQGNDKSQEQGNGPSGPSQQRGGSSQEQKTTPSGPSQQSASEACISQSLTVIGQLSDQKPRFAKGESPQT